jgi:hypothetical protein
MLRSALAFVFFGSLSAGCGGPDPDAPTYWRDVRPILDESCARCHTAGGQGPVSFDDPNDVITLAPLIRSKIETGQMPPPAPDPGCADYVDSDRYWLDEDEKATLFAWMDADMPMGDEADATEPPPMATLAPWDLELRGATEYTPTFTDGNPNDYRCWAIDVGNESEVYLTGLEAIVDHPGFVHHVVLFDDGANILGGEDAWSGGADPTDADGFTCDGFGQGDWMFLHGWAPGSRPIGFPDGFGVKVQAHAKLIIQAHYFDNGDVEPDAVGYGLNFADSVEHQIYDLPVYPSRFAPIPAGDPDYVVSASYSLGQFGIPLDLTLLSVWPHMHVLGSGFDYDIEHADGSTSCVVHQDGWSFHNQVPVDLLTPVVVSSTDRLNLACHYDNSADNPNQLNDPPIDVEEGEGTNDEMCFGFTYALLGSL